LTDHVGRFASHVSQIGKPTSAFNQRHDCLLMTWADDRIYLPVTDLAAGFNRGRTLGNGAPTNDLATAVLTSSIALAQFLLAAKVFPKRTAFSLLCISMPVNSFVADRHESCNLHRTQLVFKMFSYLISYLDQFERHCSSIEHVPDKAD
jgi:hypothetical protein